ncbi:MAG: hypothetical protein WC393_05650 [Candidatus Nanoarchaeia archaeon]
MAVVLNEKLLNEVMLNLRNRENIFIVGKKNVGKTFTLNYLSFIVPDSFFVPCLNPKQLLILICSKANVCFKNSDSASDLIQKAKNIDSILLIDDFDSFSKPAKKVIDSMKKACVVASGKSFHSEFLNLELKAFTDSELKIFFSNDSKLIFFAKNYSDCSAKSCKNSCFENI